MDVEGTNYQVQSTFSPLFVYVKATFLLTMNLAFENWAMELALKSPLAFALGFKLHAEWLIQGVSDIFKSIWKTMELVHFWVSFWS